MKTPIRLSISIDENTNNIIKKIEERTGEHQSRVVRDAIKFYFTKKEIWDKIGQQRLTLCLNGLSKGEYLIVDINLWFQLMALIEKNNLRDELIEIGKKIGEYKATTSPTIQSPEEVLIKYEAQNFYKLIKTNEKNYTLILTTHKNRDFLKALLESIFKKLGYDCTISSNHLEIKIKFK